MRVVEQRELPWEEEEVALENMIRRRNRESQEKFSQAIERNIKIINKEVYQAAVGTFRVDFAQRINGKRHEYVTRFKIKTRGNKQIIKIRLSSYN